METYRVPKRAADELKKRLDRQNAFWKRKGYPTARYTTEDDGDVVIFKASKACGNLSRWENPDIDFDVL